MHIRYLTTLATASLVAAALGMPAASASSRVDTGRDSSPLPAPCQSNINPATDTGVAVPAQRHPASSSTLSTKGAVAFRQGTTCTIDYVIAYGQLVGSGPVPKVDIDIRANVTGGPLGNHPSNSSTLASFANVPVTVTTSGPYYILTANFTGYTVSAGALVWVVMQVKMNPSLGQWSWEVVQPDPAGIGDEWRNPNGGYGCGGGWKPVSLPCLGGAAGKGLMAEVGT